VNAVENDLAEVVKDIPAEVGFLICFSFHLAKIRLEDL
jgi:hypothetical protein